MTAQQALQVQTRKNNIEISGFSEKVNEDLYSIICEIGGKIGIQINKGDIDIAHRVPTRRVDSPRPIIVRFINRWKKQEILDAKPRLTTGDFKSEGPRRNIYIGEHLSPHQ